MNKGVLLVFVIIAGAVARPVLAQVNVAVPDYFDQFFNNYYILNPANTDTSYTFKINADNKSETGLLEGVQKIYVDGDLKLKTARKEVSHFIGVQAINSREGDFISRSRLYGRYSWRAKVSQNASLSAGISMGFVNYAFKASQSGAGGVASVPDGNVGVWYLRKEINVGLSVQQMFKQKIQPVNQVFELNRFINFNAFRVFSINPHLKLKTHFYARFQENQPVNFSLAPIFEIHDRLEAGVNIRQKRGVAFIAGMNKIYIGSSKISLYFSYLAGLGSSNVRDNAVELYLSFQR